MFSTVNNEWKKHFLDELKKCKVVKIISPFIGENIVDQIISNKGDSEIQVITRYNLNDFRSGVSSLKALKKLVQSGCSVRGIKGLHSKVYLFDDKCTIVTSANLTNGGFFNNYEFGIKSYDFDIVDQSNTYFESLFSLDIDNLTIQKIEGWELMLINREIQEIHIPISPLPDFGTSPLFKKQSTRKYFIKFFGRGDTRFNPHFHTRNMLLDSNCHFAITFSKGGGRPRRYNTGDVVFLANMTHGKDYSIFGRAIAMEHVEKRDVASEKDIEMVEWKRHYCYYIRITDPVFIDSELRYCPKMSKLIEDLSYESFKVSFDKYLKGENNINPKDALKRKADVELTEVSAQWIEDKFDFSVKEHGQIPVAFIKTLYQGS